MIKYGELSTKKDNINAFLKQLKKNVQFALKDLDAIVSFDKGRMFVETKEFDKVIDKLHYVAGIHEYNIVYKMNYDEDIDLLGRNILEKVKDYGFSTFRVTTKRSNKKYPLQSMEVSRIVGAIILKNSDNKKVDVHNPDLNINIEIRLNAIYYYFNSEKGLGGYPVSTAGKGLLMLSGGIDSPVAGYMAIKRGVKIEAIYFESPPHTSVEAKNKVIDLAKKLALYNNDIKLHVINFTEIQETIYRNIPHDYLITIMRRMMYRISERIAHRNRCKILINGESIGQVASQTLSSMSVINEVVKIPVIRPLACFDKIDIIKISEKIDTYNISIEPYEDCCTIFVPKHPVINPEQSLCEEYEKLIDYEELIKKAIINDDIIRITNVDENKFEDLL